MSGGGPGVYGTQGQASPDNTPGSRSESLTWTDGQGRFWMFGGDGPSYTHNDFWRFDPEAPPPPNQPPTANAGADQSIDFPTSNAYVSGSGTDPDGTIAAYAWTQVSGPADCTIGSSISAVTYFSDLYIAGTYIFRLTVTDYSGASAFDDIQITVNGAPNQAPTADAGADQTITLPTSSVTLDGSGSDPDGSFTYVWSKVGGPAGDAITTPTSSSTNITGLVAGTYTYRLTVTDNGGASAFDDIQITVNSATNQTPAANAGADQTITLPTSSVILNGSGTDPDGTISSYAWSKISGPAGGTITSPAAASTNITGLVAGTYTYRLTVTDNGGASAFDDILITVNSATAPPNQTPSANAGADQTITLPTSSVTLNGSGTDPDGTISSYAWTKISGPAGGAVASPAAASTNITGLIAGTYNYRLTVTDNGGTSAFDDIQITVNSATNQTPAANAGADQTITLPTSSVTLNGSGTDPDGNISAYAWTKVSGPAGGAIGSPATGSTNITGLVAGTYNYRLTVTDNGGASAFDDIQITVNSANNQTPNANAGADQTITLPTSSVTLNGSGTDPDGTISSYAWTKVSGPAGGAVASPAAASTNITGLVAGTYNYRLTVTDNGGASAFDDIQITVNSATNQTPAANAGADQTITLPTSSVTLNGSGTDPDGTISSYAWTKVSGPAGGVIGSPATGSTSITGLIDGTYIYRLTITDNLGATATDDVQIIVELKESALIVNTGANPGSSFSIRLQGAPGTEIRLTVTDIFGRTIESRDHLQPNTMVQLGQNWKPGVHMVQVQQGKETKVIKLVRE